MSNTESSKKVLLSTIGIAILVICLVGVAFAFFNYTRTGAANTIRTGRIYYSSEQDGSLNITNTFPMKSNEVKPADLDSVTIDLKGDTTYVDGEEFVVTITDVNNTVNGKQIPINFIAKYEPKTNKTIGSSSNDYWNARNSKNANIYLLHSTGKVVEDNQLLVGYIDNEGSGIEGTLTVKAYIDADGIAISDTYPEQTGLYEVDPTKTDECVTYFNSLGYDDFLNEGETVEAFCNGTGTILDIYFQEVLDNDMMIDYQKEYLIEHNIIKEREYFNGTDDEWVRGRTVLTTSEWNSLQTSPATLSFKIKVESNEGIWVKQPGSIDSCPGCKFLYVANTPMYTTWNMAGYDANDDPKAETPTVITTGLYDDYRELTEIIWGKYFLGVKLNASNQITNAYVCGIRENVPFCIEGTDNGSSYSNNKTIINGTTLWNNTCTEYLRINTEYEFDYIECEKGDADASIFAMASSIGDTTVGVSNINFCGVYSDGMMVCGENNLEGWDDH